MKRSILKLTSRSRMFHSCSKIIISTPWACTGLPLTPSILPPMRSTLITFLHSRGDIYGGMGRQSSNLDMEQKKAKAAVARNATGKKIRPTYGGIQVRSGEKQNSSLD